MSAPPQGMGGPTDDDRIRETRHHEQIMRLTLISIIISVVIATPVIYLGWQTGLVLEEIKAITKKQSEIDNFGPVAKTLGMDIELSIIPESENKTYSGEILLIPISNHPLRVDVENATLKDGGWVNCFFVNEPKVELVGAWTDTFRPTDKDSWIKSILEITYQTQPEIQTLDLSGNLTNVKVGWIDYVVEMEDLQTKTITKIESNAWLVANLPSTYVKENWKCSS